MGEIKRIPWVMLQEVASGNDVTGVAPAGGSMVDSEETLYRGQYRKWTACTDAGLFALPGTLDAGWRMERLVWTLTGLSAVKVNLVDEDAVVYQLLSSSAASGNYAPGENGGLLVLPGWSVQVVGTGTLSADGRLIAFAAPGWRTDIFNAKILGEGALPPSKMVP